MTERIAQIRREAEQAITAATSTQAIEDVRIRYLGRKAELPNLLRDVASLPREQRAATGKAANEARKALEQAIETKAQDLAAAELDTKLAQDRIDVTLPADPLPATGRLHLMTKTRREIEDVFIGLGFNIAEGPEVEKVYYNFDALNHALTHPSRLTTDTFYVKPLTDIFDPQSTLLRVHTSPMQIRAMEQQPPPIYIIVPGRVYRPDSDATHTPQFHQIEGLAVDTDITLADLQGTLLTFARAIFGEERQVRLRPHFFPFTEPSVEVDVSCFNCMTASRTMASVARCARARPGSRSSAPGWSTRTCSSTSRTTATTRSRSRASPSGWGSSGSRCSSTESPIYGCSTTTTSASWSSSADARPPELA